MTFNILKIRNKAAEFWFKIFGWPVVTVGSWNSQKRALLIYLSRGVMKWSEKDPRFGWHQNYRQSRAIAFLLAARGYRVDVASCFDQHFLPAGSYDLIIAHPGVVARKLQNFPKTGFRLCLRTGRHAAFVDLAVAGRYEMLRQRKGIALQWKKTGETDEVYRGYDAVACFDGDGTTSATFAEAGLPVYSFRNHANPSLKFIEKDFSTARAGFVYISAWLHVSKGLDWLLEAFAETPDRELYICGKIPPEFQAIYQNELGRPNIHSLGFVELASEKFRAICRRAAWYISPSATDGCQGTALDAMASGLIPILSDACGVDTLGAGLRLDPCTPESLRAALDRAAEMSREELVAQSRLAQSVIEQRYRPEHFVKDWNHILDRVEERMEGRK